ncbi:TerD family protein [Prevotella sp.]
MGRFNLNKGQSFRLDKSSGLSKIKAVLGWKAGADLDACAFLLAQDGVIHNNADFVFYNSENREEPFDRQKHLNKKNWRALTHPMSADGSVYGSIDDLGEEDDNGEDSSEEISVNLDKVDPNVSEIVFCVTIYRGDETGATFGDVRDPYISIINEEDEEELCRYNLKENFSTETAVVAGSLLCNEEGEWDFQATGQGYVGGMQGLIDIYAG